MGAARILWLAVLCTACASSRRAEPLHETKVATTRVADFDPAFESLQSALESGDDVAARAIVQRVRALQPNASVLEALAAFERILDGREIARTVDLRLITRAAEHAGSQRLTLVVVPHREGSLVLHAGASTLSTRLWGIDARGYEHRSARSEPHGDLERVELQGNEPKLIDLAEFDMPMSNELALRLRFELSLVEPEFEIDGRRLPAASLRVEPCEACSLARFLPTGAVEPAELVHCLSSPGFSLPAAIERTVRIVPDRRAEALDLLEPVIDHMARVDLERAVPCLRWLSGDRDLGGDPDLWRRWADDRARDRAAKEKPPELDLPTSLERPSGKQP